MNLLLVGKLAQALEKSWVRHYPYPDIQGDDLAYSLSLAPLSFTYRCPNGPARHDPTLTLPSTARLGTAQLGDGLVIPYRAGTACLLLDLGTTLCTRSRAVPAQ